jgi:hypothetical protein
METVNETYSKREIDIIIRDMGIRFSKLVSVVDKLEDEVLSLELKLLQLEDS